jgi:ABC-type glutathione transport system ATPase component
MSSVLLELRDLQVVFTRPRGLFRAPFVIWAVDGVSLSIPRGTVVGLVGESGCGKTTLSRAILGLVPVRSGGIRFDGVDYAGKDPAGLRPLRRRVQMVFQDPFSSLNPRLTVAEILAEPLHVHRPLPAAGRTALIAGMLDRVGLSARILRRYPHEFSGGQRQRLAIARALILEPDLLIADEPVSALDVSIQAQILNLLADLRRDMGLTMLFISHDLAVVRHIAGQVAVMQAGRIVEEGPAEALFAAPTHPYTQALLAASPRLPV